MNNFRNFIGKLAGNIPKSVPGGGSTGGGGTIGVLAVFGALSYGAYHSVVTVQPGHKGVIYSRINGLEEKSQLNEGLNFVIPWLQRPIVFDVRTRPQPIDTTSGSKGN